MTKFNLSLGEKLLNNCKNTPIDSHLEFEMHVRALSEWLTSNSDDLILAAKQRNAWLPFVRKAFELMDDEDGGKELEEYLMSADEIPESLRPLSKGKK